MNQFNKDIIAALSSDKDVTLNEAMPDIELSQTLVWLLNSLKAIINHELYARRAQIIQMMNQFFAFLPKRLVSLLTAS